MNHKDKSIRIRKILDDMSTANKFKSIIEGDWPVKEGDKVRLNLDAIKSHPDYEQRLPEYRKFCEENVGKVFTAMFDEKLRKSVVCLAEDTTNPKWLFWIGDLEKISKD